MLLVFDCSLFVVCWLPCAVCCLSLNAVVVWCVFVVVCKLRFACLLFVVSCM